MVNEDSWNTEHEHRDDQACYAITQARLNPDRARTLTSTVDDA